MFLVTLNYPLEMMKFFGLLFPLITFDALPLDSLYEKIFSFSKITDDFALTDQFDNSGYSSIFFVNNMGSLFAISIVQLTICLLLWVGRKFKLLKMLPTLQKKVDKLADETLWNGLIRFYTSNYLTFSVVSFIESKNLRFGRAYSTTENFCSVMSILGMITSVVFPIYVFLLYR